MITDSEWNIISQKAFPYRAVKAPPFLWTRVLALIESEETRRTSTWWMQWRWMSKLATTMALLVSLGIGIVYYQALQEEGSALDALLQGGEKPAQVAHLASAKIKPSETDEVTVAWLLGGSSWDQK